ncbi:MAG: hypothetical protein NZ700_08220 [Gemmataceae bacterium]|nr:hypothetical protein [Gemmataceae bacterium]MDW8264391.1 hypothetical protein [Gemmataceae bacterium]
MTPPKAIHDYQPGGLDAAREFIKRTRFELRELRKVRLAVDRLQIFDVNHDYFELRGIGYRDAEVVPLLRMINAAFNPQTLHEPTAEEFKEFKTGRRHAWAEDRVM